MFSFVFLLIIFVVEKFKEKYMKVKLSEYIETVMSFKKDLVNYYVEKKYKAQDTRDSLNIIDALSLRSETDEAFRAEVYKYLKGKRGYSTLQLRRLCKEVGFDYWKDLDTSNAIDRLDTVQFKIKR